MAKSSTSFGPNRKPRPMSYLVQRRAKIREILRENPDGMTVPDLLKLLPPVDSRVVVSDLDVMPDAYIDRWLKSNAKGAPYIAVWCVVVPPPNCPRPDKVV